MSRVKGRTDDMVIIGGTNVFPSQIEEILLTSCGTLPEYRVVIDREKGVDLMTIVVEAAAQGTELAAAIQKDLAEELQVEATVKWVGPQSLGRGEGKPRRVEDRRRL